jgi:hypothetical protein
MKRKTVKFIALSIITILSIIFVVIFGGPNILRAYIEAGIGGCSKIPILCKIPTQEIVNPKIDKNYTAGFIPYKFTKLSIATPRGFAVIQELENKPYYKKRTSRHKDSVIYTFRQDPGYFVKLFPQVRKIGINDNYTFIKRLIFAQTDKISSLPDAFFVILKSIFIPDIGDQGKAIIASFTMPDRKGFISYNLFDKEYYFDCNIVSNTGDFYKVYIKDATAKLELDEVFAIISTLERQP